MLVKHLSKKCQSTLQYHGFISKLKKNFVFKHPLNLEVAKNPYKYPICM
jgi:hypothetical protein